MFLLLLNMRWPESSITEIYVKNINRVDIKQYFISVPRAVLGNMKLRLLRKLVWKWLLEDWKKAKNPTSSRCSWSCLATASLIMFSKKGGLTEGSN